MQTYINSLLGSQNSLNGRSQINTESTLNGRSKMETFTGETINTFGYTKADGKKNGENITGKALRVETSPYAVIDFDILDQDMKGTLKEQILEHFSNKTKIVQTYSGGFHVYCRDDKIWSDLDKNRIVGVYNSEETYYSSNGQLDNSYAIDIFLSHQPTKRSLIVLPGSKVKTPKSNNEIREYVLLSDCKDEDLITFTEVLEILSQKMGITIVKPEKTVKSIVVQSEKPRAEKLQKLENHSYITKELFDAIVKGLDETIVVHGDSGCPIDEKLGCFHIISALYACVNENITKTDVSTSLDLVKAKITFSNEDAEKRWDTEHLRILQSENESKWTNLLKILRVYNEKYFTSVIKPLIAPKKQFESGNYTFEQYQNQSFMFKTMWEHLNALSKCIAKNNKDGGYIKKTFVGENVVYECISTSRLSKEFKDKRRLPTSDEEKQKMREQKKAVKEFKEYRIIELLEEAEMRGMLMRYNGISLHHTKGTLWQYRPPKTTKYNKELIEKWLEFMKSRVVYEDPLMEELYAHAYRFRNPDAFNVKFFVHYEAEGNAGKSFLAGSLAEMYPNLANVALKPAQLTEKHCTTFVENLIVHLEEPEDSDEMTSKGFQAAVKQITTPIASVRPLYGKSRQEKSTAIPGMNSNDSNLYGLIRADKATKSRMVIVQFKPANMDSMAMDKICKSFINHPEFAYSLYKYLKDDIEIPDTFTTERYNGKEKDEIISYLTSIGHSSVRRWLASITKSFGGSNEFKVRNVKGEEYVYRKPSWFNDECSYYAFCSKNRIHGTFNTENLMKELKTLGFSEVITKKNMKGPDGSLILDEKGKPKRKSARIITMKMSKFLEFDLDAVADDEDLEVWDLDE